MRTKTLKPNGVTFFWDGHLDMAVHIVDIEQIRIDAGTQSRVAIDEEVVSDYYDALEDGKDLPPVVAFYDGLSYYMADGFHRYHAHKRAKRELIECEVKSGTIRDAVIYSLSANATHGLRRTNADKRKAVMTCLNDPEWSDLTLREIASMCAVSHVFVLKLRKELEPKTPEPKAKEPLVNVNKKVDEPEFEAGEAESELLRENERLLDRLAVEAMDATEEEKALAQETIESLRSEIKTLKIELEAVKRSRDQYQMENNELKKQIKMLQRKK